MNDLERKAQLIKIVTEVRDACYDPDADVPAILAQAKVKFVALQQQAAEIQNRAQQ